MATTLPVAAPLETSIAAAVEPKARRWTPFRQALALTLALRVFYGLLAAFFAPRLMLDQKLIHSNRLTDHLMDRGAHPVLYALLGVWERFDTLWYIHISQHGYDQPMATVFYPLYAVLIRVLTVVTHSGLVAALLISTVATLFLFWGALRLFELDHSPSTAFRAILLWGVWPAAFTLFAGYPDSLLCALTVWAVYFARSSRWSGTGVLGLLAGLTKALGCLTALPLLWIAWKDRSWKGFVAAAASVAGTACYQGWLMLNHFPSASQVYGNYWATATVAPWTTLIDAVGALAQSGNILLVMNLAVLAIAGAVVVMPRVRPEYRLYAAAAICLFLTKHTSPLLQSTTRYSLAIFVVWPVLAGKLGRGAGFVLALVVAVGLNLLLFHAFLDWGLAV